MSRFRIRATGGLWKLREEASGGEVLARTLRVDVPMRADGDSLVASGVLNTSDILAVGASDAVIEDANLVRADGRPGYVNDESMLNWVVVFNEPLAVWTIYREDNHSVLVDTQNLRLDCRALSHENALHCRAEMLMNGATNRSVAARADEVVLRTLSVYDQIVEVGVITMGNRTRATG